MDRYYAASTNAFYHEDVHGARRIAAPLTPEQVKAGRKPKMIANPDCRIPADAVVISDARWSELLAAQAGGQDIAARGNQPVANDPPPLSAEAQLATIRAQRDRLLADSDKYVAVPDYPIDPSTKEAILAWRAALRAVTDTLDPAAPLETVQWPMMAVVLQDKV